VGANPAIFFAVVDWCFMGRFVKKRGEVVVFLW